LRSYRWSSYMGYARLCKPDEWLDHAPILALVSPGRSAKAEEAYRRYVEAGLAKTDGEFRDIMRGHPLAVGRPEFCAEMQRRYEQEATGPRRAEDVSFRRLGSRISPVEVKARICQALKCNGVLLAKRRQGGVARGLWAWALQKHAGLTQREIAALLGLTTGSAVSALLKRHRAQAAAAQRQCSVNLLFEG